MQAIVRVCNKYKIRFKASSTFWSAQGFPTDEGAIQLDMRRMDRILEIDKKNMFAVIEPHVIGTTLQAEAMKVGLNTHIHGSGSSCSCLASATSFAGPGPDSLFMSYHADNMLGAEWVMPNGDLLRVGSLGSGLGWFCCDGPGPSLKGLIRGGLGASGALGVFTRIALKLYPWPGPAPLPVEGIVPAYKAVLPDNFRVYTLSFPTWQAWADSCYLIWDAGIGYIAHRQFNMFGRDLKGAMVKILSDPTKTLYDITELVKDPKIKKLTEEMKRDYQIVLAGMTPRDIEWQEKALDRILEETGGWRVAEMMNDPDLRNWALLYMIRLGHKNLNLVYGGGYDGCFGLVGSPDFGTEHIEEVAEFKAQWEKKGNIVLPGVTAPWEASVVPEVAACACGRASPILTRIARHPRKERSNFSPRPPNTARNMVWDPAWRSRTITPDGLTAREPPGKYAKRYSFRQRSHRRSATSAKLRISLTPMTWATRTTAGWTNRIRLKKGIGESSLSATCVRVYG